MLRACRRLLRPGGRTAYFTISVARGLSKRDHRRAVRMGPRAVAARADQRSLLERAGFAEVAETDVTDEFLETARLWIEHARDLELGLRSALGDAQFEEIQNDRATMVRAVEEGLLVRSFLVGTRAGDASRPDR